VPRDVVAERKEIDAVVAHQTVCTLFADAVTAHGSNVALKWKKGDEWESATWKDYAERVRAFGKGMIALGLEPGEFVNFIGSNVP